MHLRKKGHIWWNAMGYIRPDGTNVITSLMDPIKKKRTRKKGQTKQLKRYSELKTIRKGKVTR